jgi:Tfp pilus assembly protein PilN
MLSIDFLPERIKLQRARRKYLVRQAYFLGVCVVALVVLGLVRSGRISSARAERALLKECRVNTQRQLAIREKLEVEQTKVNIKKQIDDQLGSRVNTRDILAELSRLLPKSMSLTKFSFEATEVPMAAGPAGGGDRRSGRARPAGQAKQEVRTVRRVVVIVDGLAPNDVDVANFIGQLSACPLFEDVHMGYTRTLEFRGQEAREFQARCYLVR